MDYETEIWLQFAHGEISLIGSIQIFREDTCLWCSYILLHSLCNPARWATEGRGPRHWLHPHGGQEERGGKGGIQEVGSSHGPYPGRSFFFVQLGLYFAQEFEISFLNSWFETTNCGIFLSCPNKCGSSLHMSRREHSSQNPQI